MNSTQSTVKFVFIGDICLNDDYNEYWKAGFKPFAPLDSFIKGADIVIGNLECMVRGDYGTNPLRPYSLTAELETMGYLKDLRLGLVGLANNHVYDNLDDGFDKTIGFLEANGIAHFGASIVGKERDPFIFRFNGVSIGVLNYVTQDTNPTRPVGSRVELNWLYLHKAQEDILKLHLEVDHVVVYPHWGGEMEGSMFPEPALRDLAHKLVDFGADLIIGHHSHTLQPFEIYKGKHIFYSLGNFCFSEIYKDGKRCSSDYSRTHRSLMLMIEFSKVSYSVSQVGITNDGKRIHPQDNADLKLRKYTERQHWLHMIPFWHVYYFYEKNIYKIQRHFFANGRNPLVQLFAIRRSSLKKVVDNLVYTLRNIK